MTQAFHALYKCVLTPALCCTLCWPPTPKKRCYFFLFYSGGKEDQREDSHKVANCRKDPEMSDSSSCFPRPGGFTERLVEAAKERP